MFVTLQDFFDNYRIANGKQPNETVLNRANMRLKRETRELKSILDIITGIPLDDWEATPKNYEIDEYITYDGGNYKSRINYNENNTPFPADDTYWELVTITSAGGGGGKFVYDTFHIGVGGQSIFTVTFDLGDTPAVFIDGILIEDVNYQINDENTLEILGEWIPTEDAIVVISTGIAIDTTATIPFNDYTTTEETTEFTTDFDIFKPSVFIEGSLQRPTEYSYLGKTLTLNKSVPEDSYVLIANGGIIGIETPYTKQEVDDLIAPKRDITDSYSQQEVEDLIEAVPKTPGLSGVNGLSDGTVSITNLVDTLGFVPVTYTGNGTTQDIVTGIESYDLNYDDTRTYATGEMAFDRTNFKLYEYINVTPALGSNTQGVDLISNGTFESDVTGWTGYNATPTWNAGGYLDVVDGGGDTTAYQVITTVPGRVYEVSYDVIANPYWVKAYNTSTPSFVNSDDDLAAHDSSAGTNTFTFTALSTETTIGLRANTSVTSSYDNIVVKDKFDDTYWSEVADDTAVEVKSSKAVIKCRDSAEYHHTWDTLRGSDNYIHSNETTVETNQTRLTSFNVDGVSVNSQTAVNQDTKLYVIWHTSYDKLKITTTNEGKRAIVAYDNISGRSMTLYQGSGTAGHEIPHGLSVAPDMFTSKNLSSALGWMTYTESLGGTSFLYLNTTAASDTAVGPFNDTSPNSTTVTLGTSNTTNTLDDEYIIYSETSTDNISIGTYTGTGVAGNFVDCGFTPSYVIHKRIDTADNWFLHDNSRNTGDSALLLDSAAVETSLDIIDFEATGYSINITTASANLNGGTYLYIAYSNDDTNKSLYPKPGPTSYPSVTGTAIGVKGKNSTSGYANFLADLNATQYTPDLPNGDSWLYTNEAGNLGVSTYEPLVSGIDTTRQDSTSYYDIATNKWVERIVPTEPNATVNTLDAFGDGSCIAAYQFNDDSTDLGGNYDLDSVVNATYITGKFSNAIDHAASSTVVKRTTGSPVDYTQPFSFSYWFKSSEQTASIGYYASWVITNLHRMSIGTNQGGTEEKARFLMYNGSSYNGATSQITITDGQWHLLVGVYDGTNIGISVDGESLITNTFSGSPSATETNTFGMGNQSNSQYDQVRIFDRAITNEEITQLYLETEETTTVDTLDVFDDTSCIATYQLNGDATDLSGNFNGIPTSVTYGTGKFGQAAVGDGVAGKITTTLQPWATVKMSISFWINYTSTNTSIIPIGNVEDTSSNYFQNVSGSGLSYYSSTNSLLVSTGNINDGLWHNITVTQSSSSTRIFVDGILVDTGVANTTSTVTMELFGRGNLYYFDGSIDQVRIFDRALGQQEVDALYTETPIYTLKDTLDILGDSSCIAQYKFENDATDESGTYDGTPTSVTYGTGKFGQSAVFNGTSSIITTSSIQPSEFTISCWLNAGDLIGYQGILAMGDYEISMNDEKLGFATVSGVVLTYFDSLVASTWYHVVLNSNGEFYVDGAIKSSFGTISWSTINTSLLLGKRSNASQYFNGQIDQVRIFNRVLTAAEVTEVYNENASITGDFIENIIDNRSYIAKMIGAIDGKTNNIEVLDYNLINDKVQANEFVSKNSCTAWVRFDGTTTPPTVLESFNVSDVAKTSTGQYIIYFDSDMKETNYTPIGSAGDDPDVSDITFANRTLSSVLLRLKNPSAYQDDSKLGMVIFGGK